MSAIILDLWWHWPLMLFRNRLNWWTLCYFCPTHSEWTQGGQPTRGPTLSAVRYPAAPTLSLLRRCLTVAIVSRALSHASANERLPIPRATPALRCATFWAPRNGSDFEWPRLAPNCWRLLMMVGGCQRWWPRCARALRFFALNFGHVDAEWPARWDSRQSPRLGPTWTAQIGSRNPST